MKIANKKLNKSLKKISQNKKMLVNKKGGQILVIRNNRILVKMFYNKFRKKKRNKLKKLKVLLD